MSSEELDDALAAKMRQDFDKLILLIFSSMKNKGYIREDLSYSFDDDPYVTQFVHLFLKYVMRRLNCISVDKPQVMGYLFRQQTLDTNIGWNDDEEKELIKEIIAKKKNEMLSKIIKDL